MEIRRDIALGPGVVAVICIIVGFATIGLFVRMTPAIQSILQENVESQEAAREILECVAARSIGEFDEAAQIRLRTALARASTNVTIDGEQRIIDALNDAAARAITGDDDGFRALVLHARALWNINRQAMEVADADAARLGSAGAWTAVFGGIAVVLVTIAVIGRMRRRIAMPLEDITRVVAGQIAGGHHLRCRPLPGLQELELLRAHLNAFFDAREAMPDVISDPETGKAALRQALVVTLAATEHPAFILHADDRIVAGNPEGLALIASDDAQPMREALVQTLADATKDTPSSPPDVPLPEGWSLAWFPLGTQPAALAIVTRPEPPRDLAPETFSDSGIPSAAEPPALFEAEPTDTPG